MWISLFFTFILLFMATPTHPREKHNFNNLTVAAFESLMAKEMENLILLHGGKPLIAPAMREMHPEENKESYVFFERLREGHFDILILVSGIGTRALFQALETQFPQSHITKTFKRCILVACDSQIPSILSEYGLKAAITLPGQTTWRDIPAALVDLTDKRVAVQEFGFTNRELLESLRELGAQEVESVPINLWALPDNTKPLAQLIESILKGKVAIALFTSGYQVHNLVQLAESLGRLEPLMEAFTRLVVGSVGTSVTDILQGHGFTVDFEPEQHNMDFLVREAARKGPELHQFKSSFTLPVSSAPKKAFQLPDNLFLKACRRERTFRTPVWIMRQAGRYLPEYRKIRSKVSFLELCKTPELAAEAAVSAQEALGVDAAILFADILLIAEPLGFQLEFPEKGGPVIRNPFGGAAGLKRLREVDGNGDLGYVMEAVRLIRSRLKPGIPLIGFAGAPFTVASYLLEGGASKDFSRTRAVLGEDISVWDEFMVRIVKATVSYLNAQVEAGAQALQLFDSWVGILTPDEYKRWVLPFLQILTSGLKKGVPLIYFGVHTEPFFPDILKTGATVIGLDSHVDLGKAWKQLGDVAIQGNLDPNILLTDPDKVRKETEKILQKAGGRPGHIFNLGHGILPETPLENVRTMIDTVKTFKL